MSKYQNIIDLTNDFFNRYAKKDNQYVYHIKPTKLVGDFIYTLSAMKNIHFDIYKKEIKKYEGREKHLEREVKLLNCQWKDCINLSTINPSKIFDLLKLLGSKGYENSDSTEIFKFDINDLKDFDFCYYDDSKSQNEAYKKISINNYKELEFIPIKTCKYFIKCKENNEYPLIFGDVPHILIKGNLPIKLAKTIKYKFNDI